MEIKKVRFLPHSSYSSITLQAKQKISSSFLIKLDRIVSIVSYHTPLSRSFFLKMCKQQKQMLNFSSKAASVGTTWHNMAWPPEFSRLQLHYSDNMDEWTAGQFRRHRHFTFNSLQIVFLLSCFFVFFFFFYSTKNHKTYIVENHTTHIHLRRVFVTVFSLI